MSCAKDMRMADPKPTFAHLITQLRDQHSDLAYIHIIEDRVGADGITALGQIPEENSNDFLREIWSERRFLSAAGYTRELGIEFADGKGDLIVYGRPFLANVSCHLLKANTDTEILISLTSHSASNTISL
jgi:NADPH2 dehydrogenase